MTLLDDMLYTRYILKQRTVTVNMQVSDTVAVSLDKFACVACALALFPDSGERKRKVLVSAVYVL